MSNKPKLRRFFISGPDWERDYDSDGWCVEYEDVKKLEAEVARLKASKNAVIAACRKVKQPREGQKLSGFNAISDCEDAIRALKEPTT